MTLSLSYKESTAVKAWISECYQFQPARGDKNWSLLRHCWKIPVLAFHLQNVGEKIIYLQVALQECYQDASHVYKLFRIL